MCLAGEESHIDSHRKDMSPLINTGLELEPTVQPVTHVLHHILHLNNVRAVKLQS